MFGHKKRPSPRPPNTFKVGTFSRCTSLDPRASRGRRTDWPAATCADPEKRNLKAHQNRPASVEKVSFEIHKMLSGKMCMGFRIPFSSDRNLRFGGVRAPQKETIECRKPSPGAPRRVLRESSEVHNFPSRSRESPGASWSERARTNRTPAGTSFEPNRSPAPGPLTPSK